LYWSKKEGDRTVQFDGIPFSVEKVTLYDCQYGEQYWKDKAKQNKRLRLQTTRKLGCHAHITTCTYKLFPEYQICQGTISHYQLRKSREDLLASAREAIKAGLAKSTTKHFMSLPTQDAHSGHPVDKNASFCQRVNPIIISKISEFVSSGITETKEVQRVLNNYVKHNLQSEHGITAHVSDRAFYPLPVDIKNHVDVAKRALQLSKFDQENLRLKINGWRKQSPESLHHFRPFIQCKDDQASISQAQICSDTEAAKDCGYDHTLLWVHQESWQRDLLLKYGSTITLIDATYKTTKYDLALFFLCVPTNVNYAVVAEFVVQFETAECISEALSIIKQWNPKWCPPYFMTDYSDAEQLAISTVFPDCIVYLCDFHREQCWERWVKDRNHNLTKDEANTLLSLLRECAHAPSPKPQESLPQDHYFNIAVSKLKKSSVWSNVQVSQWLSSKWLSICQVSIFKKILC